MIIFLLIIVIIQCFFISVLGVLFYYLNKRFEALRKNINDSLGVLTDRTDKTDKEIVTLVKWCEVLRDNQDVLQEDTHKLFYGVKKAQKSSGE